MQGRLRVYRCFNVEMQGRAWPDGRFLNTGVKVSYYTVCARACTAPRARVRCSAAARRAHGHAR